VTTDGVDQLRPLPHQQVARAYTRRPDR
jgi:hypothetical protein